MNNDFFYKNKQYRFNRYPESSNRSLQAWSAVDEYLLQQVEALATPENQILLYNDRFGMLACCLAELRPLTVITFKSQEKSLLLNLKKNELTFSEEQILTPLEDIPEAVDFALVKIPKALELFQFYLYQLSQNLKPDGIVVCAFMTRHFTPKILDISKLFFDDVSQSKAWKKSRLLTLKNKKPFQKMPVLKEIIFKDKTLKQYPGVFSSQHIDYASQFLIENIRIKTNDHCILDLASGNGILALAVRNLKPEAQIHLMDDSFLAVASSRLNLVGAHTSFHYNDRLDIFEDCFFDCVISNPPFHLEFENNIEVSLRLFGEVRRCLKPDGHFQLVANRHLNYKIHLENIFTVVEIVAENERFVVYDCCDPDNSVLMNNN